MKKIRSLKSVMKTLKECLIQQKLISDTISEGNFAIKNKNVDLKGRSIKVEQKLAKLEKEIECLDELGFKRFIAVVLLFSYVDKYPSVFVS